VSPNKSSAWPFHRIGRSDSHGLCFRARVSRLRATMALQGPLMSATQMNSCTQFSRSSTEDSPMSGNGEQPETNRTSAKRFLAHPGMRVMRNFGLGYEACRKATVSKRLSGTLAGRHTSLWLWSTRGASLERFPVSFRLFLHYRVAGSSERRVPSSACSASGSAMPNRKISWPPANS
jgi:hypothetical protein